MADPIEADNLNGTILKAKIKTYRPRPGFGESRLEACVSKLENEVEKLRKIIADGEITRVPTGALVLEGPLAWAYHEGWSIDSNDVLSQIWAKWTETYRSEGPHGLFRVTIERLE